MTAPTLTRRRIRNRDTRPTLAQVEFAAQVVDELAANRPVFVTVDGEGSGWCITGVDVDTLMFTVWRDRGEMTVAWAAVSE